MFQAKKAIAFIAALLLVATLFHPAALASVEKGEESYNENDYNKLTAFFDQPSATEGVKNGDLYGFTDDPATWTGVTWTEDAEKRVEALDWEEYGFAGSLNLSDMISLVTVNCGSNEITALDVTGCTALWKLWCYNNALHQKATTVQRDMFV